MFNSNEYTWTVCSADILNRRIRLCGSAMGCILGILGILWFMRASPSGTMEITAILLCIIGSIAFAVFTAIFATMILRQHSHYFSIFINDQYLVKRVGDGREFTIPIKSVTKVYPQAGLLVLDSGKIISLDIITYFLLPLSEKQILIRCFLGKYSEQLLLRQRKKNTCQNTIIAMVGMILLLLTILIGYQFYNEQLENQFGSDWEVKLAMSILVPLMIFLWGRSFLYKINLHEISMAQAQQNPEENT